MEEQDKRRVVGSVMYDVPMFMSLLGFGIGMMFDNSHVCGMMFLFGAMLYMLLRYTTPSVPMCFRCLIIGL